jgi:NADH:ubiquinone oxidoreductase subunit 6 (subunit J)
MKEMKTFLVILVVLAMLGTVGVLFAGVLGLVRGGADAARSNALMRWRVVLQGAALLLFMLLMSLLRS